MTTQQIIMFLVMLLSGTGVFLVGVHLLTSNIEQLATGRIKKLFGKTADKRLVNVGIGAATTAIIQSSGVTTVLIVGFVNVGIMSLSQATAMIMGANIGTTITAQIAALSAFPFTTYIQILVFVGIFMSMLTKNDKLKKVGMLVAGLGLVFIGLSMMSDSMESFKTSIQKIFEAVENPFLLFFLGIVLTAIVQSSSATTSIIIAMSVAGLQIGTGGNEVLYFILGTNIGSCVTAIMSSFGAGANAKRASLIHLMFNVFGSIIFFIIFLCFPSFMDMTFKRWFSQSATQIAMFHTFFNVVCTIIFLPFSEVFVKLSKIIIKDKKKPKEQSYLDERMISSPSIALEQISKEMFLIADLAMDTFRDAYNAFEKRDMSSADAIRGQIDKTSDKIQNIVSYMIKVSANCSEEEEKKITTYQNCMGDIERISDIADNFIKYTRHEVEKNMEFSDGVMDGVNLMVNRIYELYDITKQAVTENDKDKLAHVDEVEDMIDGDRKRLVNAHIERLNKGQCKAESSGIFINLISNIERIGDHITYIAHSIEA